MNKRTCSFILLLVMFLVLSVPAFAEGETQTAEIPVTIVLEGPAPDPAEVFTVQLTAVTEGAPMPAGASDGVYEKTITGAGSLTLEMEYGRTGVYSYTLRQLHPDHSFCDYDDSEYSLVVYVTVDDKWNPELTTVLADGDGEKVDEAVFTDVYKPLEPAKLDPPVEKIVISKKGTAPSDAIFTFAMIPELKDAPMPDNDEARRDSKTGALYMDQKGPGSYEFGWMTYTQEDVGKTYVYTLKEIPGTDKRFEYDTSSYTMTVKVSQKDGKVVLDVTYEDPKGESVDKAVFTNTFTEHSKKPKTGDDRNAPLWIEIMTGSGAVIALSAFLLIKKKRMGN